MAITLILILFLFLVIWSFWGFFSSRVEQADYKVVEKKPNYEIRFYPAHILAQTTVGGSYRQALNKGFRIVAGYIFGENVQNQKIAMTAPVTEQSATSEKIAMTAPVAQTETAGQWLVRFTMPRQYTLAGLPQPDDAAVKLRQTPPARFAVIRFSGLAKPAAFAARTADLNRWIAQRSLHPTGPATLAQYDPPWTIWFMRRNEVMIPIAP
jgi:hypothetical protein